MAVGLKAKVGFSLVEVLVCLAVVAALLALFLPVVRAVRVSARQLVCISNLREVSTLIRAGALERRGFGPVLGQISLNSPVAGAEDFAAALGDPYRSRYRYAPFELWPGRTLPMFLEDWLRLSRPGGGTRAQVERLLACPAAQTPGSGGSSADLVITGPMSLTVGSETSARHYASNAYVLSYRQATGAIDPRPVPLAGRLSAAKNPASIVLFAEAVERPGAFQFGGDQAGWPSSLADLSTAPGAAVQPARHGGKLSVAFVDGHIERTPATAAALARCRLIPTTGSP